MFSEKSILSKLILPILIIVLLSLPGCGSKSNNTGSSSGGSTSPAAETTTVTYENYLKIKLDTTYADVQSILGEGKKNTVSDDVINYTWSAQGKIIAISTNKGKVDAKSQAKLGKIASNLTVDQFKQVKEDMTIDQVVSILGPNYREVSTKKSADSIIKSVVWMMPDSTYVKVKLQDNKVIDKSSTLKPSPLTGSTK